MELHHDYDLVATITSALECIAVSNPVGTANGNAKEPIKMVGFFVVLCQFRPY